jgi:hypothetical protein
MYSKLNAILLSKIPDAILCVDSQVGLKLGKDVEKGVAIIKVPRLGTLTFGFDNYLTDRRS